MVYPGADAVFTLYEDDGLTYAYEKGKCSMIPLLWDDASGTLTIGERSGSYPGMLAERTFVIRLAGTKEECKEIYKGEKLTIALR